MGNHLSLTASVMMGYWGKQDTKLRNALLVLSSRKQFPHPLFWLGSHALALGISMHWQPSDGELA